MTKGQFRAPLRNQGTQKPGLPQDQASMADQDTASLRAIQGSSPVSASNSSQYNQGIHISLPAMPTHQPFVLDLETAPLAAVHSSPPATPAKTGDDPPGAIQRILRVGLARLQEPQPEGLLTRGLRAVRPGSGLGIAPALALTNAFGLLIVSISYYISVLGYSYPLVEAYCFGGLLIMVVPNLVRLLSRAPTRLERIYLLCVLAGCCYFVQFMSSPLHFSGFDEFLHWRTADDILRTGHLFNENSMLPASPYYPGLEIVTNAVSTMTGLSTFYAGNIVIAASRLLMVSALFLLYEHITSSSRMASIATVIYMANPHFLFFDALYSYETLALPLATLMIYILTRYWNAHENHRWVIGSAWIILVAITITHHMTDYVSDGLLLLWTGVSLFQPVSRNIRIHLATIAIFGLLLSLAYAFLLPGNPVWSYLSAYFGGAFNQLAQIITGSSLTRPLFSSLGQAAPVWDKLFMTASVALVTFSLPFGLLSLQRQHRNNALAITFGIASLLYPLTQAFRFTSFGVEITDRAAAFLFLPIAYILTILITHFWPTRRLNRRALSLITGAIAVIFVGGVIVGSGPGLSVTPGPYMVVADSRSIESEGIEAAMWSLAYLKQDNRVATDRINQMLMNSYGHQRIVTSLEDSLDVSPIFYSAQFDNTDIAILQEGQIHYLAVDTRLSTALPLEGTYFENDRPRSVISRDALTKFSTVTQINRLFDSGNLVIYDTGALIQGTGP
ncbi:MAG: hypothetical protein ACJ8AG_19735 [Ktedonobacteraceae bacterium]